jgi:hypothetical protein
MREKTDMDRGLSDLLSAALFLFFNVAAATVTITGSAKVCRRSQWI